MTLSWIFLYSEYNRVIAVTREKRRTRDIRLSEILSVMAEWSEEPYRGELTAG